MPRRWWRGAVLVSVGALLAGCGGSPEASPAPTPAASASASASTSESPSVSPTPAPPERPAAVTERNRQGVVATARWWVESINHAAATGQTAPFRKTYTDFCTRCEGIADTLDQVYDEGGSITGGAWVPTKLEFYGIVRGIAYVDVIIDSSAQVYIERAGAQPERFEPSTDVLKALQLEFVRSEGWRVAALDPTS